MKPALAGIVALALSGCSTVAVHTQQDAVPPPPFAGTKLAWKETKRAWHDYRFYGEVLFVAWDVPLSLASDTVLLPVDYYRRRGYDSTKGEAAMVREGLDDSDDTGR